MGEVSSDWAHCDSLYIPKCLEGAFSEVGVPFYGVLRSSGAFHEVRYPLTTPKQHRNSPYW